MAELAADSILTVALASHVRFAQGHSEFAGNVSFLHELGLAVGEGAVISKFALLAVKPELANLSLLLLFVSGFIHWHIVS